MCKTCAFVHADSKTFTFLSSLVDQAKVPTDIPASVLNKTSEVIDAQLGYVKQLGTYIKISLKVQCTQPYNQHLHPLAFDLTLTLCVVLLY